VRPGRFHRPASTARTAASHAAMVVDGSSTVTPFAQISDRIAGIVNIADATPSSLVETEDDVLPPPLVPQPP
jgi:hypothetical protein